jgi:ABC-type multidrug transport system fused ATPase/permease subunit
MTTSLIPRLWKGIVPRRRRQLLLLLGCTLLACVAEVFSIGAVLPFLGVLTAPDKVFAQPYVQPLVEALGLTQPKELMGPVTALFCASALLAACVRVLTIWLRTHLTFAIGADLSNEIYRRTLHQPYAVHLSRNSSEVIDGISRKVETVIFNVLNPLLVILSHTLTLTLILAALLWYEPVIALVAFGGFGFIYLVIYKAARARLRANSRKLAASSTQRIKTLQEGLGGIRDVLLDNAQSLYCAEYRRADQRLRRAQAENGIIGETPRYGIEALGICMIALLAFQLAQRAEGFEVALPLVGALAIAAQRMLPLLQQIYHSMTNLRGSEQSLLDTLALLEQPLVTTPEHAAADALPFSRGIVCRDLGFSYREAGPWVLRHLDLRIPKGSRVGFVGSTGSGKSTLLDVVMGLLQPTEGALTVDGQTVTAANSRLWQARIAHVPQAIYLSDASIAQNIAFGVPRDQIDSKRLREAAAQAQIAATIEGWPAGYETLVGERGVRLSGGQRQRIGIARALYRRAEVLVLDEATSALDNETEHEVMKAIEALGRHLTILIVAHRITTLQQCDTVVELAQGRVVRCGSYASILGASTGLPTKPRRSRNHQDISVLAKPTAARAQEQPVGLVVPLEA